jgi:tight adherence protein C
MTAVVVSALGAAIGMVGVVVALRPAPPSVSAALAALDRQPSTYRPSEGAPPRAGRRVDRYLAIQLATAMSGRKDVRSRLWPLLVITGTSIEELCGEMILAATAGFVLPTVWWTVVSAGGVHLSFVVPIWVGLASGIPGAFVPVVLLRSQAARARRSARRAIGSYLNLVVLSLAGGMGIEGALHASAHIGENDMSDRILHALDLAQDAGEPPWGALDRLGRDLGVTELTELAAAVGLAGGEGVRIRMTLAAKANSIRRHDLAEAESEANTVTERLFLPGVFLLVGFLVFIGYPAVARISAGL